MGLFEVPGASVFILNLGGKVGGKPAPLEIPQPLSLVPTYREQRDHLAYYTSERGTLVMVINFILVGERRAFLASGSEPTWDDTAQPPIANRW